MQKIVFRFDPDEQLPRLFWRDLIRRRAGYKCETCGVVGASKYDAHHIDGDGENNCLANGMLLCHGCHQKTMFELGQKKREFAPGTDWATRPRTEEHKAALRAAWKRRKSSRT